MQAELWQFAEVAAVYGRLKPVTPYGHAAVARRQILTDRVELDRRYDRIESMMAMLDNQRPKMDQVRHHLKRIPRLPLPLGAADAADLFTVKKFLVNYKAIHGLLDESVRLGFALDWQSEELLKALDTGGSGQEIFYIGDSCSPELAAVRKELRTVDQHSQAIRASTVAAIKARCGLDFEHRDFLVVDTQAAGQLGSDVVFMEPFDSRHVIVRPILPKQHFETLSGRESLLAREQEAEKTILAALAAKVASHADRLEAYAQAIESLDVALAAAELAAGLRMTRPQLAPLGATLEIVAARLVPLEEDCSRQQLQYRPLSASFDTANMLLHGSNMSGKSVVLKTVASLQILAQLGVFVPAERFRTVLFDNMFFIGGSGPEDARGLSSFGREMVALRDAMVCKGANLFVIDEFARTTNSKEAAALIAGLLNHLNRTADAYSLMATHYVGLPAFERIGRYRMKGLDWQRMRSELPLTAGDDLVGRVKRINRCMTYEMVPDSNGEGSSDAIGIAEMLGLDETFIEFARRQVRDCQTGKE